MSPSGMGVWSVSRRMQRTESSVGMPGLDTVLVRPLVSSTKTGAFLSRQKSPHLLLVIITTKPMGLTLVRRQMKPIGTTLMRKQ